MSSRAEPLAITGLGIVSPAGRGIAAFERACRDGASRLGELPTEVARGLPVTVGGRVPNEVVGEQPDRAAQMSALALEECLADAGLLPRDETRVGLALGTALGGMERPEAFSRRSLESLSQADRETLRGLVPQALARELKAQYQLRGGATFTVTCASALYALEQAWLDLCSDRADVVACGGIDTLSRYIQGGFCALEALSTTTPTPAPPSDGILLGEAVCFVALERIESAHSRGARVRGLIRGRGLRSDSTHITSPDTSGQGMRQAVEAALKDAQLSPAEISRISLTAIGSPAYQAVYEGALPPLFGANWRERAGSWEPTLGHLLGASGSVGTLAACIQLEATPACHVLALTVGFGGFNGATVISRPEATR